MPDLNFSYGFTEYPLESGSSIQRPMLPVILSHGAEEVATKLLVDSGADYSMLQRPFAEDQLGIDVESLAESRTSSVGGELRVARCQIDVRLEQHGNSHTMEGVIFEVPLNRPGYPVLPLIGREPLFHQFKVNFRMGYTSELGKFVLSAERPRDSKRFRVGGKRLARKGAPSRKR